MTLQEVQAYLNGKTIAMVGNSVSLFNRSYGADIENHDVVLRMGICLGANSDKVESLGKRTDVWASNASKEWREEYFERLKDIKCMLFLFPYHRRFYPPENGYRGRKADYLRLKRRIGAKPSTGALVLRFLEKYIRYKKISIYGINNFQDDPWTWKTAYPDKPFDIGPHDGNKERKFFEDVVARRRKKIRWWK